MESREHCSILLIDDDPLILQCVAAMLARFTPLRVATSGQTGLHLARQSTPDLVLLDVGMPGMDGFDVCKAFKSDPALADVPIIFSTGHQSVEFGDLGRKLGAVDFIPKSQLSAALLSRVVARIASKGNRRA